MIMEELKIDLSGYSDRFSATELSLKKNVNFVFGRNGTGKSTITDQIENQFSDDYDVEIFRDFEGIAQNNQLNAIALGKENAEIQGKIEIIDEKIAELRLETLPPKPEEKRKNLFTKQKSANDSQKKQAKKLEDFYTKAASDIKNQQNPPISTPNYRSPNLKKEISKAKLLSNDEIKKYKDIIKSEKKAGIAPITLPSFSLEGYLKAVNEILTAKVQRTENIPELMGNSDKENFAKRGIEIHEHKSGEKCAFCGSEISEERWGQLSRYFNDEVAKLNLRIKNGISKMEKTIIDIEMILPLKETDFYSEFRERVKDINLSILAKKDIYHDFLENLKKSLEEKANSPFVELPLVSPTVSDDFSSIKEDLGKLVDENNDFSRNLKEKQDNARNNLRYNEIKKALDSFKHETELVKLDSLKSMLKAANDDLRLKNEELEGKLAERAELVLETRDEEKIANKINITLGKMGFSSFRLELVHNEEGQKGQYQIRGHKTPDGKEGALRTIEKLSKGEKNIIAFLYFVFSLEAAESWMKPKVIVFDDPMTSNDDAFQYLITNKIKELCEQIKKSTDCLILLTHNSHFYLNVQPEFPLRYNYENGNIGHFHFLISNNLTTIKSINKEKNDFKTNYAMLWKELHFLFDNHQPDLMLGCCRRICENYKEFTCKINFYRDNEAAKKLFDVNQHSMYDTESEPNGKSEDEIIAILKNLFEKNGGIDHFKAYWQGAQSA